ncbi:MAG: hypothetical protein A3C30_00440 [Candidatus Levybacteria bacterium RIFCSPHIGHO2_02_FULL_40_18]|nr:MAG: hypothetical protein A2869_04135 [Candidatus Levybacteria bacterium RIFCSPHIGHO2_01_FULL_40_58]OGH27277.1 MAG: hypothetical protein A3C30_00440 [Candidatus Levybacteria bacterium RIFCSPHIGHO2_02_FULL_40_18]OGH31128.1 MAG: hypothetical protein A3E43_04855 [Candidatus Levybacteria bacterium RIFCSPHIGHO2_12_FULL_40_31]OGH41061.1 MAG: hypothetical protein A2894_02070 [Candidatus Levybacteria bacterium RIFCSPLOWO2_01_FULL_40_64]OGH49467.1 MAG: hypothetical protein A3I54_02225 [Candidatus Lev
MVTFKDLIAWQEGIKLVLLIYKITKQFPREELFALTTQMRRCAISVTSNIAEGFSRRNKKEKNQFYYIALGSVTELHNQLIISKELEYVSNENFLIIENSIILVHKLLNGLIKASQTYT